MQKHAQVQHGIMQHFKAQEGNVTTGTSSKRIILLVCRVLKKCPSFIISGYLTHIIILSSVVQVRKAMQRKKEIWSSRRTTFFTPSSTIPSSTAAATTSHGATLSVIMFDICHVVLTLFYSWKVCKTIHLQFRGKNDPTLVIWLIGNIMVNKTLTF